MWRHQLADLVTDFRVIAPDLRGFGASDVIHGTVTMDQFADDLDVVLTQLGVEQPIVLCGLSMGGYIAWEFVRRHRARLKALILCDTRAVADPPDAIENRKRVAATVLEHGAEPIAAAMPANLLSPITLEQQPELLDELRQTIAGTAPQGISAASLGMAARPDSTQLLSSLDLPALLVVGEDDRISTVAEMRGIADAMPQAQFVVVPAAGHMAPLENPGLVNTAIREFLGGSASGS
jgi:pimeloyl-ACP methyl ester carboxylesterase